MACISAETGTLVFAIINLVLVTGFSLLGVGMLIFWGFGAFYAYNYPMGPLDSLGMVLSLLVIIGSLFTSLISLLFSSFLMNGILKKKPEHIKVYYIFGIVKIVLGLALILTLGANVNPDFYFYVIVLGIFTIYSLILYMIRYTYLQYETNQNQYGHQHLVEKC